MDEQIKQYLTERHIDVEKGLSMLSGNDALYLRLLKIFPEDSRTHYAAYLEALEKGDLPAAQRSSHAIKGTSGSLRMGPLFLACTEVNDALKNGSPPSPEQFAAFDEEYKFILDAIAGLENLE